MSAADLSHTSLCIVSVHPCSVGVSDDEVRHNDEKNAVFIRELRFDERTHIQPCLPKTGCKEIDPRFWAVPLNASLWNAIPHSTPTR